MKYLKLISATALILIGLFLFSPQSRSQVPSRLFDVQNGNGAVVGGTTYPQAIIVPFKDVASKTKLISALATNSGWSATLPDGSANSQTAQQAATAALTNYLKGIYKTEQVKAAANAAGKTAGDSADAELP